jgi:hypothetical protein
MPEPVAVPDAATEAFGEWHCGHGPCPVRTVLLRLRVGPGFVLPALRCPLCLRTLAFGGWAAQPVANCRSPASPSPGTI